MKMNNDTLNKENISLNQDSSKIHMDKVTFRDLFHIDNTHLSSNSGSPFKVDFDYETSKNGEVRLVEVGKTNVQDLIQASAAEVDINILMKRFNEGEIDVFDRVYGQYADVVGFPSSYAEMHRRLNEANKSFESLPPEVKELFNNSPIEYYTQFGSDEFISKINSLFGDDFITPIVTGNEVNSDDEQPTE